jgi:hypothetical protein
MRDSALTFTRRNANVGSSHTSNRPVIVRIAGLTETTLNKPDISNSRQGAAGSFSSNSATTPKAAPNTHVCTTACTHEGAIKGAATSAEKAAVTVAPVPKSGNETLVMDSPEVGLGGRPIPKYANHKDT